MLDNIQVSELSFRQGRNVWCVAQVWIKKNRDEHFLLTKVMLTIYVEKGNH